MLILFWRDDDEALPQVETEYRDTNDAGTTIEYVDSQTDSSVEYILRQVGAGGITHILRLPRRLEGE